MPLSNLKESKRTNSNFIDLLFFNIAKIWIKCVKSKQKVNEKRISSYVTTINRSYIGTLWKEAITAREVPFVQ